LRGPQAELDLERCGCCCENAPERSELLHLLAVLPEHTDDDDIVTGAKDLRAALSDGS
jgi:hypothetical protein